MQPINYPFDNSLFNAKTSVLLDACFLLALLDKNDPKFTESNEVLEQLVNNKCKLFVTSVVSAEVLNIITVKLFTADIRFQIDGAIPLNTEPNIRTLVNEFSTKDKTSILNKNDSKVKKIYFKGYFNSIYKNQAVKNILSVYFCKAVEIQRELEDKLNIKYISMSKETYNTARDYISQHMLCINDASHLSAAEQVKSTYLLTADGDFSGIQNSTVTILKI